MKIKKFIIGIIVFALLTLMIATTKVYAADVTLDEVVTSFNNCKTVKEYMIQGSLWEANSMGTSLIVTASANGTTYNIEYTLDGTVLNAVLSGDENFVQTGAAASVILADSIGQLHGYEDGELFPTLNSEQITNYTLENEGIEDFGKIFININYEFKKLKINFR